MNVNIGELNKRIKIVSYISVHDDDGYENKTEITVHECWAKVSQVSGTELIKSGAEFTNVSVRFLIRYTPKDVNEDMQILFNGKYYNVVYINNYGFSNEFIEIFTEKRELV